jgi:hypothetical protein
MAPHTRSRPTPELQLAHLKIRNRSGGNGRVHRGRLTWRWRVQPTPMSRIYQVRLECDAKGNPEVFVDSPDIRLLAGDRKIPHLYSQARRKLCLYLPGSGQWNTSKLLANTIVPWVSLWLLYFEEWLWSDDWKGGGEHPVDSDFPTVTADVELLEEVL